MNHKHNYILDNEVIGLSENLKLPISEIFLECVECNHILRGHEIVEYIHRLEARPDIRDLAAWLSKQMIAKRWIAGYLLDGDIESAQSYSKKLIKHGATDAWIACAPIEGERDEAINQLIAEIAEWKEKQHGN